LPIVVIQVDGKPYEFYADRQHKQFTSVDNARFYLSVEDVTDGAIDDVIDSCQVMEH
jgi:hypothetical protein